MKSTSITATLDSDDAPKLTQDDFERARFRIGFKDVSREEWQEPALARLNESQKISIMLDQDVIVWLNTQTDARDYQTLINAALREAMQHQSLEALLRRVIREELTRN
ncbi:MAG: BrnA antitoxin family protein [Candidatus Contendobacter sp.]|nr:BrnA antitoxin family protein [Candidatus Contendobacter sp.]